MLKAAVKSSPQDNVRHRVVPPEAVAKMAEDLANLKQEVQEVLREEKEEKAVSDPLLTSSLFVGSFERRADSILRFDSFELPIWRSGRERT